MRALCRLYLAALHQCNVIICKFALRHRVGLGFNLIQLLGQFSLARSLAGPPARTRRSN